MAEGERIIEKSRRPDGTLRKEIRVRPGFKSEELDLDTRAYHSKGALRKAELEGYVPGATPVTEQKKTEAEKRKERRQRKKAAAANGAAGSEDDENETETKPAVSSTPTTTSSTASSTTLPPTPAPTSTPAPSKPVSSKPASDAKGAAASKAATKVTAQMEKASLDDTGADKADGQLRKLQKLLRQITQLEDDAKAGKTLTPEQTAKLARKKEVESQIAAL